MVHHPRLAGSVFLLCLLLSLAALVQAPRDAAAQPQSAAPELDIMLVLDNSGSMKKNDPEFLTRQVVSGFLDRLGKSDRLGLVIFADEADLAEPLRPVGAPDTKPAFLNSLEKVNYRGNFTNSAAGVERGLYELRNKGRAEARKVVIFLTDGIVDTGDKARDARQLTWLKESLADDAKRRDIRIYGVAFTDKADFQLIQSLALKTGGEYFRALTAEEIEGVFARIKESLTKVVATTTTVPPPPPPTPATLAQPVTPPAAKPAPADPGLTGRAWFWPLVVVLALLLAGGGWWLARGRPKPAVGGARGATQVGFASDQDQPLAQLEALDYPEPGHIIEISAARLMVGRSAGPNIDLVLPHSTVSGLHACIEYRSPHFYLEDQRSTNGTFLNDQKLEQSAKVRLKNGDIVAFDRFRFRFVLPEEIVSGKTVLSSMETGDNRTVIRPAGPAPEAEPVTEPPQAEAAAAVDLNATIPDEAADEPGPSDRPESKEASPAAASLPEGTVVLPPSPEEEPARPSETVVDDDLPQPAVAPPLPGAVVILDAPAEDAPAPGKTIAAAGLSEPAASLPRPEALAIPETQPEAPVGLGGTLPDHASPEPQASPEREHPVSVSDASVGGPAVEAQPAPASASEPAAPFRPEPPKDDDDDMKTMVKRAMCANHPARRATELCPVCNQGYCAQCMTEKEGRLVCRKCAAC